MLTGERTACCKGTSLKDMKIPNSKNALLDYPRVSANVGMESDLSRSINSVPFIIREDGPTQCLKLLEAKKAMISSAP